MTVSAEGCGRSVPERVMEDEVTSELSKVRFLGLTGTKGTQVQVAIIRQNWIRCGYQNEHAGINITQVGIVKNSH